MAYIVYCSRVLGNKETISRYTGYNWHWMSDLLSLQERGGDKQGSRISFRRGRRFEIENGYS